MYLLIPLLRKKFLSLLYTNDNVNINFSQSFKKCHLDLGISKCPVNKYQSQAPWKISRTVGRVLDLDQITAALREGCVCKMNTMESLG